MPTLTRGLLTTTALTNVGLVSAGLILASGAAMANPTGSTIINGTASISSSGNTLTVNQSSANTTINWQSFSIAPTETTNFVQPTSNSVAFNRVTGANPSDIEGHLNANGQVVLVNPNGVLFTKTAQVNVGGLVATTSDFSNAAAANGQYVGTGNTKSGVSVDNEGSIVSTAGANGLVALVSPMVVNNGVITATLGKVHLAAGDQWSVDLYGDKLVTFAVNNKYAAEVTNGGTVTAAQVNITASAAKGIVNSAINMTGIVEASNVTSQGDAIVLSAPSGTVTISGKLSTTGVTGGAVSVTGDTVNMTGATIAATGAQGGGVIDVNATTGLTGDAATSIDASSTGTGNGGSVTVASAGTAQYAGAIAAKGGSTSGNGGTVVTTGNTLNATGMTVDTSAANGTTGSWTYNNGTDTVAANDATLLQNNIGTTNEVVGGTNLTVASAIAIDSPNSLTFSAYDNVNVNAGVVNTGLGNLVIRADNAGAGAGLVTFSNDAPFTTDGAVSIYYHPLTYTAPGVAGAGVNVAGAQGTTEYMLVDNVADLNNVATNLAGTYALGANISAVGAITPIGNAVTPFSGLFDGFGGIATYSLGGVTATALNDAGLFGDNSGTIRNLAIDGLNVSGNTNVGGLVGYNSGTLSNDSIANGYVYGYSVPAGVLTSYPDLAMNVGGLVGFNTPTGLIQGIDITATTVMVDWNSLNEGGVIGTNYGLINGASFTGTVTAGCNDIGGFVGANYGQISNAVTNAVVTNLGGGQTGGFAGLNGTSTFGGQSYTGTLTADTANTTVNVGANNYEVGGFVGTNQDGAVINGGTATGTFNVTDNSTAVGGFAGDNLNATIVNSISDVSLSVGSHDTDVGNLAGANSGVLTNDTLSNINLSAGSFTTAAGGYVGANLSGGTISGITQTSTVVAGNNSGDIGGLVGYNDGMLVNDGIGGTVNAGNTDVFVGGLVGSNDYNGTVQNGTSTVSITQGSYGYDIGGLIGVNYGTVTGGSADTTIATGNRGWNVGGFAGQNFGKISGGSAAGSISVLSNAQSIGGFIGGNNAGTVTNAQSSETIQAGLSTPSGTISADAVGGLVGWNDATVDGGNYSGTIQVGDLARNIGGVVGHNLADLTLASGQGFTGSLVAGSGATAVGGIAGLNTGTVNGGTATGNLTVGDNTYFAGGAIGWNDSGATVSNVAFDGTLTAGNNVSGVGGIVGLNGSDTTNDNGFFLAADAVVESGTFNGTVSVGSNSFAVGGLVGWDSKWTAGNSGTGTTYYGSIADGYDSVQSGVAVTGTGSVVGTTGTTYIHDANQNGCDERAGGNCFGTAGQEVITVDADNLTQTYGDPVPTSFAYTISGLAPGFGSQITQGDVLESYDLEGNVISGQLATNANGNAGTYQITQGTLGLNAANANALLDYVLVFNTNTGTYTINKAVVTVTADGTQVYGASSPSVSYSYNGLKNNDPTSVVTGVGYTTSVTSATNVGIYGITATGGLAQNYTIVDAAGNLVVTPAPLTITPTGTQVYGSTPTVSYGYTGLKNNDPSSVVTGVGYTTPATSASNVGTYAITATGGAASNYTITDGTGSLTVTPASLVLSANDADKVQGDANPPFTYTTSGLVLGQTSSVIVGLQETSPATQSSPVGQYAINLGNGTAQNYTLTYVPGVLTVLAPLTTTSQGQITPLVAGSQGDIIPLVGVTTNLANAIPASANLTNQIECLKVNLEIRGVTTDSPIDCSSPLEVNGF